MTQPSYPATTGHAPLLPLLVAIALVLPLPTFATPSAKDAPAKTAPAAKSDAAKAPAAKAPAAKAPAAKDDVKDPGVARAPIAKPPAAKSGAAVAKPEPPKQMRLLDTRFAGLLCRGWNKTTLPKKLGRSGSEWIDQAGSTGKQVVVVNRRDCRGWKKVQLVIEADTAGNAVCKRGGAFRGGKYQWKFEPKTVHWADFTDGFGSMKMPKIMSGFVGPYSTAMNNISNFEVFFSMAGYLALKHKVDWQCTGADKEDVDDEVKDIDKGDMRKILRGMAILR